MKWINADKEKPKITRIEEGFYACSDDVLCYNKRVGMYVARWSEFEGERKNFWNPSASSNRLSLSQATHGAYIPLKIPNNKDDE